METKKIADGIVKKLVKNGFKAYFAGGCVRDMLLGLEPKDYDIATDAKPRDVIKLFNKTKKVGIQFGVVRVIIGKNDFEVATFRSDEEYFDGRHPSKIRFCNDREDALRRDFTINGLFYDPIKKEVIDYVGGRFDLKKKIIKAIGDPIDRFNEDKLRIIRAIRFSCEFNFKIEKETYNAVKKLSKKIHTVSSERIRDELLKILTGKNPRRGIELLDDTGILKEILPDAVKMKGVKQPKEFHPEGDVFVHTLLMLEKMKNPLHDFAFAVLLHDIGKPPTFKVTDRIRFDGHTEVGAEMAEKICRRLKLSNESIKKIVSLIKDHLKFMNVKDMRLSTLKKFLRGGYFNDLLELHRIDCLASHKDLSPYRFCKRKLKKFLVEEKKEALRPKPLINGYDLIKLGYKPGPIFKKILTFVEDAQLENKISTKQDTMELVKQNFALK